MPAEVDLLQGNPEKANRVLGWKPNVTFRELARLMTDADLKLAEQERRSRPTRIALITVLGVIALALLLVAQRFL